MPKTTYRCGHTRSADDELGMYCATCGHPRLPFAWVFVGVWLAFTGTYFLAQIDPTIVRPLLAIVLVAATIWCSVLILRHRRQATTRLLALFIPTVIVGMSLSRWHSPRQLEWPDWLGVVAFVATVISWIVLLASFGLATATGFKSARGHKDLRTDSLILTWLTLAGVLVTILHLALPYINATLRDWLRGTRQWEGVRSFMIAVMDALQFVIDLRFVLLLILAFILIGLATIAALGDAYKYDGRFSVLSTISRILQGIVSNIWRLCVSTIERWWLIILGILPTVLVVVASLFLAESISMATMFTQRLWSGDSFFELGFGEWFILLGSVVGAMVALIAMNVVVSQDFTRFREALAGVRRDMGGLTQAVGFSFFIVSLAFWVTWIVALAFRIATGTGPFGGFLFVLTTLVYGLFAVAAWSRRGKSKA